MYTVRYASRTESMQFWRHLGVTGHFVCKCDHFLDALNRLCAGCRACRSDTDATNSDLRERPPGASQADAVGRATTPMHATTMWSPPSMNVLGTAVKLSIAAINSEHTVA